MNGLVSQRQQPILVGRTVSDTVEFQ